jgi:hypothetical protein
MFRCAPHRSPRPFRLDNFSGVFLPMEPELPLRVVRRLTGRMRPHSTPTEKPSMAFPAAPDRPKADAPQLPAEPVTDTAPPLAPAAPEQSPWWSAPSGKPFGIPDFAHELRALFAFLLPAPQPIPVRVKARRR